MEKAWSFSYIVTALVFLCEAGVQQHAVQIMSDRLKPKGHQLELVDDNLARSEALKCFSCAYLLREAVQTEDGYRLCKECFLFISE